MTVRSFGSRARGPTRAEALCRAKKTAVARTERDAREKALLGISLTGLGVLPALYVATGFPRFADYPFQPGLAWLGVVVALAALVMFRLTHKALGQNWSVSLDVRERHTLVTHGVYRHVRHPMYTAFWLLAVAQALLLPNWIAGPAGLVGFGTLFFLRVGREERSLRGRLPRLHGADCSRHPLGVLTRGFSPRSIQAVLTT